MKKECEFCAGSGQVTHFQGVSRFLLSWEECQACGGLGFVIVEEKKEQAGKKKAPKSEKRGR
jgi:DnaJ-class molecular chaperone